ncbi:MULTISPECIES: ArsR/SmtB family transcription factor [unclassified Streptomyces]|uniref:ArsR/SmtB family transcription factor n=1 Tax=unclassified Streptomyces TaxID=2593676 RepID=UPI0009A0E62D|nr:helix-turn-helix transcriptional regulator [Streptomyces sp. TSRI0107]
MREVSQPATEAIRMVEVLRALADPVRLEIVQRLAVTGEESCNAIGGDLDIHQTTLSHHYRVLREAGVTWTTVKGRSRLVRLRRDDLDVLFPGLLDSVLNGARRTHPGRGTLTRPRRHARGGLGATPDK